MNKGLEALKHLYEHIDADYDADNYYDNGTADIDFGIIEKELKVLQIIKSIGIIKVYETVNKYKLETLVDEINLTKENYDY